MNRIRLLPEQVANQIAAGEVVERPASVVKELVENALDANATRIEIEIRLGGKSSIRITDNGYGMSRDDALLALERHATSKITRAEDLMAIATFGFRGEALPSIAAVSRFRLVTRETDALAGSEIEISGGKIQNVRDVGCPPGTTIEVRNLFFNLPARKKFLRSDQTELAHLHHVCLLQALSRPQVAFRFVDDARVVFDLAPATNLRGRLRELYSADFVADLLPLDYQSDTLRVSGFVGRAGVSRANRSDQHVFVNDRPVESRGINFALMEGYHTALMKGRYPVAFLFLEIDPGEVDVNVHPAKREVRFRDERGVREAVSSAVRTALQSTKHQAPNPRETPNIKSQTSIATLQQPTEHNIFPSLRSVAQSVPDAQTPLPIRSPSEESQKSMPAAADLVGTPSPSSILHPRSPVPQSPFRILGVLSDLYVLMEGDDGLVLMDQHAAHERVLFEQMLTQLEQGNAPSQRLLLPQTITLEPKDAVFLREHLDVFERFGFTLADFGKETVLIESVPPYFGQADMRRTLIEAIDRLRVSGRAVGSQRLHEEAIATTVCRHAVKARDPLKTAELERLLVDLLTCDLPYTCPHGRPTMIHISHTELEKKFGRKV